MLASSFYLLVGFALVLTLVLGLVLTPLAMALARRLGAVDYPRSADGLGENVPRMGGLALFAAAAIGLAVCLVVFSSAVEVILAQKRMYAALGFGAFAVLILGLVDDIRGLRARWKLLAEVAIAVAVYYLGLRVEVITNILNPDHPIQLGILELPLNVFWMVLAMNAMNIIDGLDGLAGGIFALALVLLIATGLMGGHFALTLVAACLLGAALAFLRYNFLQHSVHLGDSGSLLMGYFLAAFVPLFAPKAAGLVATAVPVAVLSAPIAEVLVTTIRRIWGGKPVGKPDNGHAHYNLLQRGLDQRRVTLFIQGISFSCGILALSMTFVYNRNLAQLMVVLWVGLMILFVAVGYSPLKRKAKQNGEREPYRAPLFLDAERVLRKKMWQLGTATSQAEIEGLVRELVEALKLGGLSLRFGNPDDGWSYHLPYQPTAEQPAEPGPEQGVVAKLSLKFTTPGGLLGELVALVRPEEDAMSWSETMIWLNRLTRAVGQAMDGYHQASASQDSGQAQG